MNQQDEPGRPIVPRELRIASEWGWRLLILAGVTALATIIIIRLEVIFVALFVALLLSALVMPLRNALGRVLPNPLAVGITMLTLLGVVGGAGTFVGTRVAKDWEDLSGQVGAGLGDVQAWLRDGPFHVSQTQIDTWIDQAQDWLASNSSQLTSGALSSVATAGEVLSGAAIALFATIFFLLEGPRIWGWLRGVLLGTPQGAVEAAGRAAWVTLTGYVRGTVIIAFADAVLIGIGLVVLGVPLAGPLAVLVFLSAFVPIVGALVAGFVAVAVALATQGAGTAAIVLIIIIVVQQLEGHILQPVVMNKAVSVHPLGVILSVAAGTLLGGIVGAVVSVPLAAVLNSMVKAYRASRRGVSAQEAVLLASRGSEAEAKPVAEERPQEAPAGSRAVAPQGPVRRTKRSKRR